jgi:dienelactone hydrolase
MALLIGCGLVPQLPQAVSVDCGVSVFLPDGAYASGGNCLVYNSERLSVSIEEIPKGQLQRSTLASRTTQLAENVAALNGLALQRTEPWLVGDYEARSVWGVRGSESVRLVVVDTPAAVILVTTVGGSVDEVIASLQVVDGPRYEVETPWMAHSVVQHEGTLSSARAAHATELTNRLRWPDAPAEPVPGHALERVTYDSSGMQLWAYRTPDPGDGEKHPVVVWAHGGFGGIGAEFLEPQSPENDQGASAFREAGVAMVIPSWRGENGNPGQLELFYGEVDDLLAAVAHARELPWADPHRVYIAGHSTGGTLAMLASMLGKQHRAAFVFGGQPDMVQTLAAGGYGNTPFALDGGLESLLRSPAHHVASLQRPTYYFEGEYGVEPSQAYGMQQAAEALDKPFYSYTIAGHDHFDILAPLTAMVAEAIVDHEPPAYIQFDPDALQQRVDHHFLALENQQ